MGYRGEVQISANAMYSLADETKDLQKQLGCMTGIFQIFDRRYFLGNQRSGGRNHKRLTAGQSGNRGMEFNNASETPMERHRMTVEKEKHRVSVESSGTSFSSSSSSTFSSVESSKRSNTELPSFVQTTIYDRSSSQSLDLDIFKDFKYKDVHELSIRTTAKSEKVIRTLKHIDSPRPQQQEKFVQPRASSYSRVDGNLAKLPEVSKSFKEEKDGSTRFKLKDRPRFSYDERELWDKSKSAIKLKEFPRLSLDSRQSSIKHSAAESTKNNLLPSGTTTTSQMLSIDQEPGSNRRSSSVVVRLMGLEALPDTITNSPRLQKEPASPRTGISHEVTKPPSSWLTKEKSTSNHKEAPTRTERAYLSVYGEIEKRLTELEFKKSGKDLRALKQILEAMQKTGRSEKEGTAYIEPQTSLCSSDNESSERCSNSPTWLNQQRNRSVSPATRGSSSPKKKSQMIEKGQNDTILVGKGKEKDPGSSAQLPTTDKTTSKTQRMLQPSKVPEYRTGEKCTSPRWSSGNVSPRLQVTKQSSISEPRPDMSAVRRQATMHPTETDFMARRLRTKSTNKSQSVEQSSKLSSQMRRSTQLGDGVSMQSRCTREIKGINQPIDAKVKNFEERIKKGTIAEHAALQEQPSPVSVLDDSFYAEEPPSPVKKISNAFRDDDTWDQEAIPYSLNTTRLVHQTRVLNFTADEATTTPCGDKHQDREYISEILSASGVLRNFASTKITQLHPSCHLINPNLFHVLESNKGKNIRSAKTRRKLVFDTVNDILAHKLTVTGTPELQSLASKSRRKIQNGEELLKEVYSEIDRLQANTCRSLSDQNDELITIITGDVNQKSKDWEDHHLEVPGLVLDIERLIFKDLISEVVSGVINW